MTGSFFTTSRLIYAAGREGYLPSLFGRLHSTRKTPLNATILQAAITSAFILMGGGFRSLINFSVVASWGFYFLTVSHQWGSFALLDTHVRSGSGVGNPTCEGADTRKVRSVLRWSHVVVDCGTDRIRRG